MQLWFAFFLKGDYGAWGGGGVVYGFVLFFMFYNLIFPPPFLTLTDSVINDKQF